MGNKLNLLYNYDFTDNIAPELKIKEAGYFKVRSFIEDTRNGIKSKDVLIYSKECYCNYLDRVNELKNYNTFLDFGIIPVIMMPPVLQTAATSILMEKFKRFNVSLIPLPGVSMRYDKTIPGITDYWISREDAGKLVDKDPLKVNSADVIRRVWG